MNDSIEGKGRGREPAASDVKTLGQLGLIDRETLARGDEISENFAIRVPTELLNIALSEPDPAVAKQFIPNVAELRYAPEELIDPIGDEPYSPVPHLTHRYPDRALLKVTYTCGVYCRFCFRRYKVSNGSNNPHQDDLQEAFRYLRAHSEIKEVILTGGDPLTLGDGRLRKIIAELNSVRHLETVRIHTRMITALPKRVTEGLINELIKSSVPIWMALHVNHARELTPAACAAIGRLARAGIPLLSQSVLLKGVNDSEDVLIELSRALIRNRVRPYYLHYPDLAEGTNHFRIPLGKAIDLVSSLRGRLSGFAIPQLIVDIPGGHGKVALDSVCYRQISDNEWLFTSPSTGAKISVRYPAI